MRKPLNFKYFNPKFILIRVGSFSYSKIAYLIVLFTLLSPYSFGQSEFSEIDFYFETDTIQTSQGDTFTNILVIKNNSNQELQVSSIIPEENYEGLLLPPRNPSTVPAGKEQKLFVKFIATVAFMKMKSDAISFSMAYKQEDGKVQTRTATFYRERNQSEEVRIYPFSRENYLDPSTPESNISVFIENTGYASRSIQIEFEPNYAGIRLMPNQLTVNLEGKEKKLVELTVSLRQQNRSFPEYIIRITGTDLVSNKQVSSSSIKLNVLSNITQIMSGSTFATDKNFIETAYNQSGSNFEYVQLKANSKIELNEAAYLTFNTTSDYYLNREAISLYDTYLEYERKGSSVRLGNIFGNDYDFSISGRGLKAIGDLGENKKLELLAADNNYNLFSNYTPQLNGGITIATKYSYGDHTKSNGKVSYLYDDDPLRSINTHLAHYSSSFLLNEQHRFNIEAGASHEEGTISGEKNLGASTGVNYDFRGKRWEVSSNNTYATKSYAGMNRGSFYLYQNLGYRFAKNKRVFLQYRNSQSQPEYITQRINDSQFEGPIYIYSSFYSTQALLTGFQFSNRKWSINLSPQVEKQKNQRDLVNEAITSFRFRTAISTTLSDHSLNLAVEYSYMEAQSMEQAFTGLKSMLSYRFKRFSVNATAQYNPYNINDLNYYSEENEDFINFNIYSSYNFAVFNKINGNVSAGVNYSDLYKNRSTNFNTQLEYKISPTWASTASLNYSRYASLNSDGYQGNNYQFRIGLKKYLSYLNAESAHRVSLQFYHDQNLNGVFDKGETVLANQIVKLGKYVAMTDKNGKVSFRNVPKGNYKVYVSGQTELRMLSEASIVVNRNINSQIPLGKSNKVKGKLVEIRQAYDDQEADVRGVMIYAEDESGEKTYTAVGPNDEFELFLKNGTYRIYIENQRYKYLEPSKTIQLNNEDHPEILIFKFEKKNRQIKVKQF